MRPSIRTKVGKAWTLRRLSCTDRFWTWVRRQTNQGTGGSREKPFPSVAFGLHACLVHVHNHYRLK